MSGSVAFEIAVGLSGAALGLSIISAPEMRDAVPIIVPLSIGLLAAWIAWQDVHTFTIPDGAVLALACLGTAARLANAVVADELWGGVLGSICLDFMLSGGCLIAVREITYRCRGYDTVGFGDVKLGAAGGILLGTDGFAAALFAASLAGLCLAASAVWRGSAFDGSARVAFGALLAPALWIAWMFRHWLGMAA